MPTHEEFLAAIIAHRDDDGPRKVYADWLDEQGEHAQAELIRVQCELAKAEKALDGCFCDDGRDLPECKKCVSNRATWERLSRCADELLYTRSADGLNSNWWHWAPPALRDLASESEDGPLALKDDGGDLDWTFRRGFPVEVTCTAEAWLGGPCDRINDGTTCPHCQGTGRLPGHADALLAATPLETVRLTTWPEELSHRIFTADDVLVLLYDRWPGIRFELPPAEGDEWIEAPEPRRAAHILCPACEGSGRQGVARTRCLACDGIGHVPADLTPASPAPHNTPRQQFRQFLADMNQPPRRPGGRRRR